jgi:Protein of unknown function (DUF559)
MPLRDTLAETVREAAELALHPRSQDALVRQEPQRQVIQQAAELWTLQTAPLRTEELVTAAAVCESPIEVAMLCALTLSGYDYWDELLFRADKREFGTTGRHFRDPSYQLIIEPQSQLGDFRVDFLLTGRLKHFHLDEKGGLGDFAYWEERKLVLECDGFDFHDRTREKASRDRERDRSLQSLGYRVYRYTGSDIWADVFKGAEEVAETLMDDRGWPSG